METSKSVIDKGIKRPQNNKAIAILDAAAQGKYGIPAIVVVSRPEISCATNPTFLFYRCLPIPSSTTSKVL